MSPADQYRRALEQLVQREANAINQLVRIVRGGDIRDVDRPLVDQCETLAHEAAVLIKHLGTPGGIF